MQGSILFNGNVEREADFITKLRDRVLSSNHQDPAIRASKKVLMVTAAWKKDEYNEGHVRSALNRIGVPSRYEGGYDTNIQNLAQIGAPANRSLYAVAGLIVRDRDDLQRQLPDAAEKLQPIYDWWVESHLGGPRPSKMDNPTPAPKLAPSA